MYAVADSLLPPNCTWFGLREGWGEVGKMSVTVYGARGLRSVIGQPDPYCVLELDGVQFKTHIENFNADPDWNETFTFAVNDITSTLEICVQDNSCVHLYVCLGKLSIPLLRINNEVKRWHALKNRSQTNSGKKKCPRILLEMTIEWNPIKASLRVMSPKETKNEPSAPDFNMKLLYYDLKFITDVFHHVRNGNEFYKRMFESDKRARSAVGLAAWTCFWLLIKVWVAPNMILATFLYYLMKRIGDGDLLMSETIDESVSFEEIKAKEDKTFQQRLKELRDVSVTTKNGIDYIVGLMERIKNLVMFRVPFLSYLAMIIVTAISLAVYYIPINYLFIALGFFKFTRKQVNPKRIPNNDLLDFLSRVPDHVQLKHWRELRIPENLSDKDV